MQLQFFELNNFYIRSYMFPESNTCSKRSENLLAYESLFETTLAKGVLEIIQNN